MRYHGKSRVLSRPGPPASPSRERSPPPARLGVQAAQDRATGALLLRLLFSSGAVTPPDEWIPSPSGRSDVLR